MHQCTNHGAKAERQQKVEAEKDIVEQNRGLAEILPGHSIQNSTPTFLSLSSNNHNHGGSTNDAATRLLEVLVEDPGSLPTSNGAAFPLNRLLSAPPAPPSPSESPRAIPITSTNSDAPRERYVP